MIALLQNQSPGLVLALDTVCNSRFSLGLSCFDDDFEPVGCYLQERLIDLFIGTPEWCSQNKEKFGVQIHDQDLLGQIQGRELSHREFNCHKITKGQLKRCQNEDGETSTEDDSFEADYHGGVSSSWSSGFSTSDSDPELAEILCGDSDSGTGDFSREDSEGVSGDSGTGDLDSETLLYMAARRGNDFSDWILPSSEESS